MVRGISKQVVVINGNHRDFFEQAFFVLKDGHLKEGISEKDLLRQAKIALGSADDKAKRISKIYHITILILTICNNYKLILYKNQ